MLGVTHCSKNQGPWDVEALCWAQPVSGPTLHCTARWWAFFWGLYLLAVLFKRMCPLRGAAAIAASCCYCSKTITIQGAGSTATAVVPCSLQCMHTLPTVLGGGWLQFFRGGSRQQRMCCARCVLSCCGTLRIAQQLQAATSEVARPYVPLGVPVSCVCAQAFC